MKNMKHFLALALVIMSIFAVTAPALAASFTGTVTGGSLYLRKSPSKDAADLASIPSGTSLLVATVSGNDEWFSTTYSGQSGYVMARYIAITTGGTAATITTSSGPLYIRATPNANAAISFTVAKGASVRVLDTTATNGFYRISCSSGSGWGSTQFITLSGGGGGVLPWTVSTDTYGTYGNSKVLNGYMCIYEDPPSVSGIHVTGLVSGTSVTAADFNSTFLKFMVGNDVKYLLRTNVDISYCSKAPTLLFGNGTLKSGSSGKEVITLQHYLNRYLTKRGYATFTVDGSFGSTTQQKVESFQLYMNSQYNAGLSVDGQVGSQTRDWLAGYVQNVCN